MALETGTFVDDLVTTNPVGATDLKSQGDDHLRLIKATLKNTFPNATKAFRFEEVTSLKVAAYSVVVADNRKLIPVDTSAGAFSVSLPAAATAGAGFTCTVLQTVSSTNLITIDASGAETINGSLTITLTRQYESVNIWCDGSNWYALYSERTDDSLESKGANYTAVKTDKEKSLRFTATATLSLTAAATLEDGWWIDVIDETGVVTIDPDGAETIDGATTLVLAAGYTCRIKCDGTSFYSQFLYTPARIGLVIGTDVQAYNSRLDIYNNAHIFVTTGGSASVYTLTPNVTATAYNLNDLYLVRLNHSATLATSTIDIDGLGAINIEYRNSSGTKVVAPANVLRIGMFIILKITTAGAAAEIIQSTFPVGSSAYDLLQLDSAGLIPATISRWVPLHYESFSVAKATFDITDTLYGVGGYRTLRVGGKFKVATDAVNLLIRTSTADGAPYDATSNDYIWNLMQLKNTTFTGQSNIATATSMIIARSIGNAANEAVSFDFFLHDFNQAEHTHLVAQAFCRLDDANKAGSFSGGGIRFENVACNAFQLLCSSGNIASGYLVVEGLA